jgi:hypothetical protein
MELFEDSETVEVMSRMGLSTFNIAMNVAQPPSTQA